jgi:Flp pilus assembly protein CpaB
LELAERLFLTRKGTILVALGAALLAGLVLLLYVKGVRHNANTNSSSTPVLVARSLIQKGTPGATVGSEHLYEIKDIPKSSLLTGAYVDPSSLNAGVAAADIFPGQQLTAGDFAAEATSLDSQISGNQRAFSFPIDATRTLNGQIVSGDRVDVYYSASGTVRELLQDIPVLVASSGEITVRVDSKNAAILALAVDSGRLWMTLRPRVGAPVQPPVTATPAQLGGHS